MAGTRAWGAAATLREGLHETFTVNALGLPPTLMRCLCTTNTIEKPNGIVRRTTRRVTHYRDADMALRWTVDGFVEAPKSFRKIQGIKHLGLLRAALRRTGKQAHAHVDEPKLAAQRVPHRRRLQLPVGHRPASERALTFWPSRRGAC